MINSRPNLKSTVKAMLYLAPLLLITLLFTVWPLVNCFKHRQNRKRFFFKKEEDGLFTFHLMVRGKLKAKQW